MWNLTFTDEFNEDLDDDKSLELIEGTFDYLDKCEPTETYVTLVAGKEPIQAGDQLTFSYRRFSNGALLKFYGFAYSDNPYDYAEL